jgi:hypothetical protein
MQTFVSHISHTNEQKTTKNHSKTISQYFINILKSSIYKNDKTTIRATLRLLIRGSLVRAQPQEPENQLFIPTLASGDFYLQEICRKKAFIFINTLKCY